MDAKKIKHLAITRLVRSLFLSKGVMLDDDIRGHMPAHSELGLLPTLSFEGQPPDFVKELHLPAGERILRFTRVAVFLDVVTLFVPETRPSDPERWASVQVERLDELRTLLYLS